MQEPRDIGQTMADQAAWGARAASRTRVGRVSGIAIHSSTVAAAPTAARARNAAWASILSASHPPIVVLNVAPRP